MSASQPAPPPPWLPEWMVGTWAQLAEHPFVQVLLVAFAGVALAVLARSFVLFWGLKAATSAWQS